MLRVLGISGKRGAGKDTLAAWLIRCGEVLFPGWHARRLGLADPIKNLVIYGFGVERDVAFGTDELKQMQLPHGRDGVTVRDACKAIGQAYAWLEPNHWVRRFVARCREIEANSTAPQLVICTDVRFPKEVAAVRELGGKVIRLKRAPVQDNHETETALDGFEGFDATIEDCSIEDTQRAAVAALLSWGWIKR